jgi:gamma-glutamyltranspeptidase/glutathione hydrolase
MPGGDLPKMGQRLLQKDLAATLETIMAQGADGFHDGPVAERIAASVQKAGGVLTIDDLRSYRPVWRAPVRGEYRGATIWSMPPPSSGGVHLVQMLNILENFPLPKAGYGAAATLHPMIEAMKFAYADRSRFLGDPDHVEVPVERLTSEDYASALTKRIRPDKALPVSEVEGVAPAKSGSVHTSHFSIVDADGNAVSSTQTINLTFGSGMVAAATGVVLNDEMDDFAAAPGVPNAFGLIGSDANAVAPNKRPLSSMTPAIVMKDGKVRLVVGSPGGSRIITAVLQVVLNVLDHGMGVAEAVGAPRIHHQWSPAEVRVEPYGVSPDTLTLLRGMGHPIVLAPLGTNVQAILVDPETGILTGASDPRGEGAPAGY